MLKKLSLIVIIFILAYSQVGYYFVLRHSQSAQKEVIKENILSQLKDEELKIISLSDDQQKIYWEEDGKEFYLNGELYDVLKRKIVNGKVILYCINDKKEKALIDNYNLITKHNSSSDKKGKNSFDNPINLFVFQSEKITNVYLSTTPNNFASFTLNFPQRFIEIISPPPKI